MAQVAANTNSANSSSSSSYRYEFPLLRTSSSRAMTDNSSLSTAGETSFSQLIHWHPSVHLEFFLLHPQTLFLLQVTHLHVHPLNSKFTLSRTNCMFSSVSHTTQSFMFSIVQSFSVMGLNPWYFCLPVRTCLEPSMFSSSGNRMHRWMEPCLCQMWFYLRYFGVYHQSNVCAILLDLHQQTVRND